LPNHPIWQLLLSAHFARGLPEIKKQTPAHLRLTLLFAAAFYDLLLCFFLSHDVMRLGFVVGWRSSHDRRENISGAKHCATFMPSRHCAVA
jgi:hypothetical protein